MSGVPRISEEGVGSPRTGATDSSNKTSHGCWELYSGRWLALLTNELSLQPLYITFFMCWGRDPPVSASEYWD